jgi:hypothetical protein
LGAKPPKIFEISNKLASKNESDNEGEYVLSRGKVPEKRLKFQESWPLGTNLTIKEDT